MSPALRLAAVGAVVLALAYAGLEVRDRRGLLEAAEAGARRERDEVARLRARHAALAAATADLEARWAAAAEPLLAHVQRQARASGVGDVRATSAGSVEPEGAVEERVEVEASRIGLGPLVSFLEALEGRADVVVRSVYLRPAVRAPGLVDATVTVASVRPR